MLTYEQFLSISLTAITVALAVLAIGLAALAVWGYNALRDEARKAATLEAGKIAREVALSGVLAELERQGLVKADISSLTPKPGK